MYRITRKLQLVKLAIKSWNKDIFGRIDVKLPRIRKDLEDSQAKVHADPRNILLRDQMNQIKEDYHRVASQEESMLRQRSRINWLTLGDSNSHFFHAAINSASNRSSIHGTMNEEGEIVTDPKDVEDTFINYFAGILNSPGPSPSHDSVPDPLRNLPPDTAQWLTRPVQRDEVDEVIRCCDGSKSPGPDGFNGDF
ncbi:uncharacterized protein LOC143878990 [Tasmannia lanceolata]|uniref:uncharacterized protein LOC143878990 n=1 Tax=Tasmannia lanceolata TaxID=3420 RepID=UPI0040635CD4